MNISMAITIEEQCLQCRKCSLMFWYYERASTPPKVPITFWECFSPQLDVALRAARDLL